jgi:hypothetical protein
MSKAKIPSLLGLNSSINSSLRGLVKEVATAS